MRCSTSSSRRCPTSTSRGTWYVRTVDTSPGGTMSTRFRLTSIALGTALLVAGCSSGSSGKSSSTSTTAAQLPKGSAPAVAATTLGVVATTEQRCDPIGATCMLPFPNDHFTVADASTPTTAPAPSRLAIAPGQHQGRPRRRHRPEPGRRLEPGLGDDGAARRSRRREVEAAGARGREDVARRQLSDRRVRRDDG